MKKVLFASTALVASATFAMAEIGISGFAEMGIVGGDEIETQFHNDIALQFDMSAETDGGLTFGAGFDIDESNGAWDINSKNMNTSDGPFDDEHAYIKGDFGTLTLGEIDGAYDWGMIELGDVMPDTINDVEEHLGFNGNSGLDGSYDNQVLRYDYNFDTFGIAFSAEMDDRMDRKDFGVSEDRNADDIIYGVGIRGNLDFGGSSFLYGLGYQMAEETDIYGASLGFGLAGFQFLMNYSKMNDAYVGLSRDSESGHFEGFDADVGLKSDKRNGNLSDVEYWGVAAGYDFDAWSIGANYGEYDLGDVKYYNDDNTTTIVKNAKTSGYAVTAAYDLGGGAEVQAGWGKSETSASTSGFNGLDESIWSLGIAMSF